MSSPEGTEPEDDGEPGSLSITGERLCIQFDYRHMRYQFCAPVHHSVPFIPPTRVTVFTCHNFEGLYRQQVFDCTIDNRGEILLFFNNGHAVSGETQQFIYTRTEFWGVGVWTRAREFPHLSVR